MVEIDTALEWKPDGMFLADMPVLFTTVSGIQERFSVTYSALTMIGEQFQSLFNVTTSIYPGGDNYCSDNAESPLTDLYA